MTNPPTIEAPAMVVAPTPSKHDTAEHLASNTTAEQDLKSAGQRQINLVWETTQKQIALAVIGTALAVSAILATCGKIIGTPEIQLAAVVFMFGVANLVTGFYFGRTNHARMGDQAQK